MNLTFPLEPSLYSAFGGLGTLCAWCAIRRWPQTSPIAPAVRPIFYLTVLSASAIGALSIDPLSALLSNVHEHGKSIMAALLFGWIAAEVCKYRLGIQKPTGDQFALMLPVTLGFGRLGCLYAHCCDGVAYHGPLAIEFGDRLLFPYPLLESIFHLISFWLVLTWACRGLYSGQRLRIYVGAYCIFRFFGEYLRPSVKDIAGCSLYQWMAILLLGVIMTKVVAERLSQISARK